MKELVLTYSLTYKQGKRLVDALELMGVLAKSADRLSVEKLARYCMHVHVCTM